jgi:membrane-bound metal-dependent hydrolase YbcI (DUF457 family)
MYIGHFATSFAIKARAKDVPLIALLAATGFVDYVYASLTILIIEKSAGGHFLFIDWSHSVLMGLVWSILFALLFYRRGRAVMLILGFAVFSHILCDILVHEADIALYPFSTVHFGFEMALGTLGVWVLELIFSAACLIFYFRRNNRPHPWNRYHLGIAGFLFGMHVLRLALGLA